MMIPRPKQRVEGLPRRRQTSPPGNRTYVVAQQVVKLTSDANFRKAEISPAATRELAHMLLVYVPVVQWIERVATDHKMGVRVLPGILRLYC